MQEDPACGGVEHAVEPAEAEEVFAHATKHDRLSAVARDIEAKRLAAIARRTAHLRTLREVRDARLRKVKGGLK
jgi:hypothetical protein